MEMARNGSLLKTAVFADTQTNGRGRLGRTFHSDKNNGLYMSVLFSDVINFYPTLLTVIAAVAVCESIEEITGSTVSIKWVNDVYLGSRKVCGILTEGAFKDNKLSYAVVGIGINISEPEGGFPSEIESIACALQNRYSEKTRNDLFISILTKLDHYVYNYDHDKILKKYKEKSFIIGKTVTVFGNGEPFVAKAVEINNDFSLSVADNSNKIIALKSGEVSIRL
jgi:BirA family biotin operon repressor/biotin-[acetyl-CoA-carboxylase] ligase